VLAYREMTLGMLRRLGILWRTVKVMARGEGLRF